MADSFTETGSTSWFQRIGQSIVGGLLGIVLFLVSFPVLFWNEGRAVHMAQSLKEGKGAVVDISPEPVDPVNDGKLVHLTGLATTKETLTDKDFGVAINAIRLRRLVEMYQWKQDEKTETKDKLGGGQEKVTTYTYNKTWSDNLIASSGFKHPEGHTNPKEKPFPDKDWTAQPVTLGAFELSPGLIGKINEEEPLPVDAAALKELPPDLQEEIKVENGSYYKGVDPKNPEVGDARIAFKVTKPQTVSILARQTGHTFEPYPTKAGNNLEFLTAGTHSAAEMFQAEEQANVTMTWLLRVVGFAIMAGGIFLVGRPVVILADVLPFLGKLLSLVVGFFAILIALPLSLITIGIGWIFYRPLLGITLIVIALALLGGVFFLVARLRRRRAAFREA